MSELSEKTRRVLRVLVDHPGTAFTAAELADKSGAPPGSMSSFLGRLIGSGLVSDEGFGRNRVYRVVTAHLDEARAAVGDTAPATAAPPRIPLFQAPQPGTPTRPFPPAPAPEPLPAPPPNPATAPTPPAPLPRRTTTTSPADDDDDAELWTVSQLREAVRQGLEPQGILNAVLAELGRHVTA